MGEPVANSWRIGRNVAQNDEEAGQKYEDSYKERNQHLLGVIDSLIN